MAEVLIRAEHIKKQYVFNEGFRRKSVKAIDDVSLDIFRGETLGLVGESGCGKSTLGRVLLLLRNADEGKIVFQGKDLCRLNRSEMIRTRRDMQIIFQDPYACLNPKLTIGKIIEEPLRFHGIKNPQERKLRVKEMIEAVGLSESMLQRYPHELSGGQQQRVGIARALILRPSFIVCDEAVSALDVSIQSQILNLLVQLKEKYNLTLLFVSHNMAVVNHICDRIAVMYLGRIVEIADKETLFRNPLHPYTRLLMSAILPADRVLNLDEFPSLGDVPSPVDPPDACRFHTRCNDACEKCGCDQPELLEVEPGHYVACHFSK